MAIKALTALSAFLPLFYGMSIHTATRAVTLKTIPNSIFFFTSSYSQPSAHFFNHFPLICQHPFAFLRTKIYPLYFFYQSNKLAVLWAICSSVKQSLSHVSKSHLIFSFNSLQIFSRCGSPPPFHSDNKEPVTYLSVIGSLF